MKKAFYYLALLLILCTAPALAQSHEEQSDPNAPPPPNEPVTLSFSNSAVGSNDSVVMSIDIDPAFMHASGEQQIELRVEHMEHEDGTAANPESPDGAIGWIPVAFGAATVPAGSGHQAEVDASTLSVGKHGFRVLWRLGDGEFTASQIAVVLEVTQ